MLSEYNLTPRVHPNRRRQLVKLKVEAPRTPATYPSGGITQPVISQRVIEHDIP